MDTHRNIKVTITRITAQIRLAYGAINTQQLKYLSIIHSIRHYQLLCLLT